MSTTAEKRSPWYQGLLRPFQKREHPSNPGPQLKSMFGAQSTIPGIPPVTHETALTYSAIFTCVHIISETIASLEFKIVQVTNGVSRDATEHPLWDVLQWEWNPELNAMEGSEMLLGHAALRGNSFAQRVINGAGQTIQIWPLHPAFMRIERVRLPGGQLGDLVYCYSDPQTGKQWRFSSSEILHLKGLTQDGVWGMSPITLLKPAVEIGMAQDKAKAAFWANGVRPSGIYTHPEEMSEEAYKRLKEDLEINNSGLNGYQRPLILESGMDWKAVGLNADDAQTVEQGAATKKEIYGAYRVPPHIAGDTSDIAFSTAEEMGINFVDMCIGPWCIRTSKAMTTRLLTPRERSLGYRVKIIYKVLQMGDYESRCRANAIARQNGWKNPDEIREEEDKNPIPDGKGQEFMNQANMMTAGGDLVNPKPNANDAKTVNNGQKNDAAKQKKAQKRAADFAEIISDQVERFITRERKIIESRSKTADNRLFSAYMVEIQPTFAEYLAPTCRSLAKDEEQGRVMLGALSAVANYYGTFASSELRAAVDNKTIPEFLESRGKPEQIKALSDKVIAVLEQFSYLPEEQQ